MLVIVDTRTGNLQSVVNGFRRIGAETRIATDAEAILTAEALVLPGVGAFAPAMGWLRDCGMADALRRRVLGDRRPVLGICLGLQLLAVASEENGEHVGLGLVPGRVERLDPAGTADRVPNFGWHITQSARAGVLFPYTQPESFYYAHSYHLNCSDPDDVAATFAFGVGRATGAIERGHVFGVQFHPEKSQDAGLNVLDRFCALAGSRTPAI